uniref:Uncharacterized protein n=1 Tax=Globodera rostochiensis TaxID=31243 RepID=A0A914H0W4_GLORO
MAMTLAPRLYFERESILNYILDQKQAYKRKLKIWEQQRRSEDEKKRNCVVSCQCMDVIRKDMVDPLSCKRLTVPDI